MQYQTPAPYRAHGGLVGRPAAGAGASASQSAPSFSFPNLKPSDIIQCLAELQIPLTLEDFERPNVQRMAQLYDRVAELLIGVTPDQFYNGDDFLADTVEFPETLVDSIGQLGFFRALNKLMSAIGIQDFSLRDFSKPEPGRIRRILSAIINFIKFRESSMGVFEKYTTKTEDYEAQRRDLEQQNAALVERLERLRVQQEQEAPAVKRAHENNAALTASLREMQKLQSVLTSDIDSLKQDKAQLAEEMINEQLLIDSCTDEIARLRSLIVQNPEQLKQVLVEMNNNLAAEKADIANCEKICRDLQVKLEMMATVEQDLTACVRLAEECDAGMRLSDDVAGQIRQRKEALESKKVEVRELAVKEKQLDRQFSTAEERLARLQQQQAERQVATEEKLRALREEYTALTSEQDRLSSVVYEHEDEAALLSEKSVELRRQVEAKLLSARQDYAQLRDAAEGYMRAVDAVAFDPAAGVTSIPDGDADIDIE